jgi:type II secretory pathway component GspD/PulD (secretin)
MLVSDNFTMRETGMILQVIPKVSEDGTLLTLNLRPQRVTLDQWISHGPKNLFRQPVFGVTSFETQIEIEDGDTVLLGSSSTTDGKWVNVGFLTAKKMRVLSQP